MYLDDADVEEFIYYTNKTEQLARYQGIKIHGELRASERTSLREQNEKRPREHL